MKTTTAIKDHRRPLRWPQVRRVKFLGQQWVVWGLFGVVCANGSHVNTVPNDSVAAELSWAELELNSDELRANRVATGSTPLSGRVGGVRPGSIHQSDFRV